MLHITKFVLKHFLREFLPIHQGYFGCATGKAKQSAKTEIEKLKLADMDLETLVTEAGKV